MGILQITTDVAGQIGVNPRRVKIITTDNLATVTAAGYLNPVSLEGYLIYNTDIIDMWYGAVGNNFAVTSPGTYQVLTASIANGVISLAPYGVQTATVILNQAQIQGMYATPVQLIPAPGAGNVIMIDYATIYTNFQTDAFANGGVAIVQYDNTVHGAGTNALAATIPAAEITAAASQVYALNGNTANALTGITNKGIFMSNQTGAFTAGNAASTVVVTLQYQTIVATV